MFYRGSLTDNAPVIALGEGAAPPSAQAGTLAPKLQSAYNTAKSALTLWNSVKGLLPENHDDGIRLQHNLEAFGNALAGDAQATAFLKYRTGAYGYGNLPSLSPYFVEGGTITGWATDRAKADAQAKYNAVLNGASSAPVGGELAPGGGKSLLTYGLIAWAAYKFLR